MKIEDEWIDRRLKYIELPHVFYNQANEVNLKAKQHLRACERLAKHLAGKKSTSPKEFEQDEWLKDFVVKTADLNEAMLTLLDYTHSRLTEIAQDALSLLEGGKLQDLIRDQSDAIVMLQNQRDKLIKDLYDICRNKGVIK